MAQGSDHIVKSFDDELARINQDIMRMGGMAESQLAKSIEALISRDSEKAARVVETDQSIDDLEQELDETTIRVIALRQPVANDLREIVVALKTASDLERIGDLAKNIAKRTIALNKVPPPDTLTSIPRLAQLVQGIIKDTLDAYGKHDADRAVDIWYRDAEVDQMYTALFRELLTYMMEDPRNITPCTHLLFIAKNIERMGDHATNIAENIYFLATGERMAGGRPKGDTSSFQVVDVPPEEGEEAPA